MQGVAQRRLNLNKGDYFAYKSRRTGLLTWGQVIEEQTDPKYLVCRTFSELCPNGVEGTVFSGAIMFRINEFVYNWAKEEGWPSTLDEFYAKTRTLKLQVVSS